MKMSVFLFDLSSLSQAVKNLQKKLKIRKKASTIQSFLGGTVKI